jgi:hypothetical protein
MKRHAISWIVFLLLVLTAGCQTTTTRSPWASAGTIPVGSKLHLHKPLVVSARDNQVFIQQNREKYDTYYPFCYFELRGITDEARTIQPDTFTINRVYRDETEFVQSQPIRVASLLQFSGAVGSGGARLIVQTTVMDLHSDKQPAVRRLVCAGGFALEYYATPPTMQEITEILQGVAQLTTSGNSQ